MKKDDINVIINDINFNCRAVAIIKYDDKILFQKQQKDKYWALPGGKIHILEKGEEAIKRELKEELGINEIKVQKCFSVSEYFFKYENNRYHQYIFSYIVNIPEKEWIFKQEEFLGIEKEKNLIYKWITIENLKDNLIKPDFLASQLLNISKEEIQFISYEEK